MRDRPCPAATSPLRQCKPSLPHEQEAKVPTFHSNGALLHYEDSGDGRPVVFLHGCWMSSRFFTHQTAPGALPGCRVIAPDFRGHGRSEKPLDGHTMAAYADDVRNLIETLDIHDVTLVGWSMGAFVAWEY